ncbi:hypothetical protein EDB81DRAFT_273791 [Dactylonectria macrodidyma]|uniref:Uncharacterized protein n=1 Tax=Dactylonectria macrodidyma TaxID=307937 RepID=A0A9P9FMH0_9HYPO|nr:hypothetical protein EDB81DRAFT_273791 [Dactylonectria macrodidyma]
MDVTKCSRPTSDDLWHEAILSLGNDLNSLKSDPSLYQENKQKILDHLLKQIEASRHCLDEKSWPFKWKNRDKVTARDVLRKVAKWANHFQKVVDVAVSFDPVHAGLPWTGIRLLMTEKKRAAMEDLDTYNTLIEKLPDFRVHMPQCSR